MELFDSHLHLDDDAFAPDRDAVIARARAAGVVGMITVGTGVASSRAAVALAEAHPEVYAAVAIHPQDAQDATAEALEDIRALATHRKVVAIGETGLDFSRPQPSPEVQREVFIRHLQLSRDLGLPVIIHCRDAHADVLGILRESEVPAVIMHAFSGSPAVAASCSAAGYAISLAGPVTFRNARTSLEVAKAVPAELLLVETDAPALAPEPFRGRRNEPAYLEHTVAKIATLRAMAQEEVARATVRNVRRLFTVT